MKIAVILASMDIEYVRETLLGIMEQAKLEKSDLYIFNIYSNSDETLKHNEGEYNLFSLINYREFDGLIIFANMIQGHSAFFKIMETIRRSGIPTVCIDTDIDGFCHVGTDGYSGMKEIVLHFIEQHQMRDFVYISGLDFNSDSEQRLRAFKDVLQEKGIPLDENNIYKGTFSLDCGLKAGQQILEREKLPQAVICASDSIAMGVRRIFMENGIDIPKQVALAGFDNAFEARNSVPVLTTAQHDQRKIGMEAAKKINMYINHNIVMTSEDFPAPLVIGESCGCSSCNKIDEKTVREQYIGLKEHFEKYLYENNMMVENLNDSKNYYDFMERLKTHIEMLECKRFYMCLLPEIVEEMKGENEKAIRDNREEHYLVEGYSPEMCVVLAYENGKFVERGKINTSQMIPKIEKESEEGSVYCFSPLHHRERCLGYLIVEESEFVMKSPLYRTWLIDLSNCLENFRKQAVLQQLLKRVDSMYVKDALTGLYNRFGFERYTKTSFQHCIESNKCFMILFIDLDGLKKINDQNGHEKGDLAITTVAAALRESCIGEEICARFGGDEYVVYAQDYTEQDAIDFENRLEERLLYYNELLKQNFLISASHGFKIVFPKQGDTIDGYINMADDQMYLKKKEKKKNCR